MTKICIGVITRNRPVMLAQLLDSFEALRLPEGVSLTFSIVENNATKTMGEVIDGFAPDAAVVYEIEPQLGIPFARNHVLDISLRLGCDFTAFVDDDEAVDPNWLIAIFTEIANRQLDLVGGPVSLVQPQQGATRFQCVVWRGLVRRSRRVARKAIRLRDRGEDWRLP